MSVLNNKQFGVWMDSHQATVVGMKDAAGTGFEILDHVTNEGHGPTSNEHAANNATRTLQTKFFKEIAALMQNAEQVHVTGTGTEQEQFIRFLSETPQFKNVTARETTANKMSDERLLEYITGQFN